LGQRFGVKQRGGPKKPTAYVGMGGEKGQGVLGSGESEGNNKFPATATWGGRGGRWHRGKKIGESQVGNQKRIEGRDLSV